MVEIVKCGMKEGKKDPGNLKIHVDDEVGVVDVRETDILQKDCWSKERAEEPVTDSLRFLKKAASRNM